MTVAARVNRKRSPSRRIAASLERTLPPALPSVVEEANSSWPSATRRSRSRCQGSDCPCRITQASAAVCIATIIAVEAQA